MFNTCFFLTKDTVFNVLWNSFGCVDIAGPMQQNSRLHTIMQCPPLSILIDCVTTDMGVGVDRTFRFRYFGRFVPSG